LDLNDGDFHVTSLADNEVLAVVGCADGLQVEASWSSFNSMLVTREGGRKKVFVCHHLIVRKI